MSFFFLLKHYRILPEGGGHKIYDFCFLPLYKSNLIKIQKKMLWNEDDDRSRPLAHDYLRVYIHFLPACRIFSIKQSSPQAVEQFLRNVNLLLKSAMVMLVEF